MAFTEIPTQQAFKNACGRTGPGKIFKKKNDLEPIFVALSLAEPFRMNKTTMAVPYLRTVRKACCVWIAANEDVKRVSKPQVKDLRDVVHHTINEIVEQTYGGRRLGLPEKPTLKDVVHRLMEVKGPTPTPVGRTLDVEYWIEKMLPNHLGKGAVGPAVHAWRSQTQTMLNVADWIEHVYVPECEDDPFGKSFLLRPEALAKKIALGRGVKYCDAEERESYVMNIEGGLVTDAGGDTADTSEMITAFSGKGWAIFVMGMDETLYVNSHKVDEFHHSSFLAGGPVKCAGEIKIEAGKITQLTPKTGHYKAGAPELKFFLEFCQKHGVKLRDVQVCPSPFGSKQWFRGNAVLFADGKDPNADQIAFAERTAPTRPVPPPPSSKPVKDLIKHWENIGKK